MSAKTDLVEQAVTFLLQVNYPDGCSDNTKRSIRRKAATLKLRNGEVFYLKPMTKDNSDKVRHSRSKDHRPSSLPPKL